MSYARWVLAPTLPEHPTEPTRSYLVCGTPRSGTWLLCGLLASTGVAGRPHEYFSAGSEEPALREEAIVSAQTGKVGDSLNDEWTKRYRSLKGI